MDPILLEAERLLLQGDYRAAVDFLSTCEPANSREAQNARRRLLAWCRLACGDTKEAYELFWSCAHHEGARAGILLLTVLAGQVETAMLNWQRHCEKLSAPPQELPDSLWHSSSVVLPALRILENYPFRPKSGQEGASGIYRALLYQTQGDAPNTFRALGKVSDFYPAARLLRDAWMDDLLCLPLPKRVQEDAAAKTPLNPADPGGLHDKDLADVINSASQVLLYPDIPTLEKQGQEYQESGQFSKALEVLRRILFLDPQHTPSLERRWRIYLKIDEPESAKDDLFYLIDIYERNMQILACQKAANMAVELFPEDERALLKMCFLQSRLGKPTHLASYGRRLLALCEQQGLQDRKRSYQLWLLRQALSLDDRSDFESL